jgi:two-component system NtrC family response regulator
LVNILIIDDEEAIREILQSMISPLGYNIFTAGTIREGLAIMDNHPIDIAFLDIFLPDGNGIEVLPKIKQNPSSPEVVIVTDTGSAEEAELAITNGAWNYFQKPLSMTETLLQLERIIDYRNKKTRSEPTLINAEGIIGKSEEIKKALQATAKCVKSEANVHIFGETGTGKELFANLIHKNSNRTHGPFVVVDCTVLPEQLVESTLFGYEKGAFTGANEHREGLIKCADNGTLFLDEIGELSLSVQKSLLRVIQERQFRPVGSTNMVYSNFRLISATNRNLDELVSKHQFREDLLFRLRTVSIELPPLRERRKDIKELACHYVQELCEKNGLRPKGFCPDFFSLLETYDWPGNVRDIIATLEKAILAEPDNPILYPVHLPEHIRVNHIKSSAFKEQLEPAIKKTSKTDMPTKDISWSDNLFHPLIPLKEFRKKCYGELERRYFKCLMSASKNNIQKACEISGLKKARLYDLMRKNGINRDSA